MHEEPHSAREAAARLAQAKLADIGYGSGRVLGSMYTTPHPAGVAAFTAFMEANLGNAGLNPGTAELERELIGWLADLVEMPAHGLVSSGASEANLLALWAAREAYPDRRKVIYGSNAHFSLTKAIKLLNLEGVSLPLGVDLTLDVGAVEQHCDTTTLALVGQAGSTELGLCDNLPALGKLAARAGAHFHLDAAFGGFILPFITGPKFWHRLGRGADSLAIDPQKLGRAPIPSGGLLVRDPALLEGIAQAAPYLTRERQVGVLGTRCSAGVAGAWATMAVMGREGYRRQAGECMAVTGKLVSALGQLGLDPVIEPTMNIVAFQVKHARKVQEALRAKGWYLSRVESHEALRVVVMPHVDQKAVNGLVKVLGELI